MDLKSPGVGHLAWWFNQGFRYSHHTQFLPLLSSPCAPSPLILCVGSICRRGLPSLWQDGHHGSRHHIFQVEWRMMPIFVFVPSFLQTHPLSLVPAGSRDRNEKLWLVHHMLLPLMHRNWIVGETGSAKKKMKALAVFFESRERKAGVDES